VLAVDSKSLDPRRPAGPPTAAEREEGLAPYAPVLGPLPQQMLLTHGQRVERLAGLACAPTTLESTTIVAAYGSAFFVARHSPAKSFDRLGEFNYAALAGAVAALALATAASTWYRRRQDLNRLWR
jgi:hypothetical protein